MARAGREPLTKERIFGTALRIVDEEGLEKLTMRRLARELEVEAMALYHHVPNKDAIYDGVVTMAIESTGTMAISDDWMAMLIEGARLFRDTMLAHPHVMPLITNRTLKGSPLLGMVEGPIAMFAQAGLSGEALIDAYHAYLAYVFGWSQLAVGAEVAREADEKAAEADTLVTPDAEAFPLTTAIGPAVNDWSHGFELGLETLLRALAARNEASAGG